MDSELLDYYQNQLRSKDSWGTGELADFFGVSDETIRRRIKEGTITASEKETSLGTRWEISTEEIVRNLSQSETLQKYLEKKDDSPETEKSADKGMMELVSELRREIREKDQRLEELHDKIETLQDKMGSIREEKAQLKNENQHLRAELERYTDEEDTKALPSGGPVDFAFGTAHGALDVIEGMARKILPK